MVSRSSCLNKAEILSRDGTSISRLKFVEYKVEWGCCWAGLEWSDCARLAGWAVAGVEAELSSRYRSLIAAANERPVLNPLAVGLMKLPAPSTLWNRVKYEVSC